MKQENNLSQGTPAPAAVNKRASKLTSDSKCPPEPALPTSATMVINWMVEYTINHSENASGDSLMHAALNDVLKRLPPQERLEVESEVHDLTEACIYRRKNELNHSMLNVLNMMSGHEHIRESEDSKEVECSELPDEDMERLIMCFKGNSGKGIDVSETDKRLEGQQEDDTGQQAREKWGYK